MHKVYSQIKRNLATVSALALIGSLSALQGAEIGGYSFDGSVDVGLDNQYNFRGVNFGEKAPWLGVDLNLPITSNGVALNVGSWYINPTEAGNDEYDAYAYLVFPIGEFEVSVGGIYFAFPEADTVSGEFGASVSYSPADAIDLGFSWWSDVKGDDDGDNKLNLGHYFEFTAGKSFSLNEWLGLDLTAGISYGVDYFGVDSFNHAFFIAGLPISISETTTLNPYIGQTISLGDLDDAGENDHFLAGISLSVGF